MQLPGPHLENGRRPNNQSQTPICVNVWDRPFHVNRDGLKLHTRTIHEPTVKLRSKELQDMQTKLKAALNNPFA